METEIMENGSEVEVLIKGRLDTSTAGEARTLFEDLGSRFDKVTLNLKELSYCSSAGIRAIRLIYKLMKEKKGRLETVNVPDAIMQIFEVTGVTALLSVG